LLHSSSNRNAGIWRDRMRDQGQRGRYQFLALMILLAIVMMSSACGNHIHSSNEGNEEVTVDHFFIPENYLKILEEKQLTEIAAMPYFKSPFITIASNDDGEQFAVLIRDTGEVELTQLPLSLEDIIPVVEAEGFAVTETEASLQNLSLLEINNQLVWTYVGEIYLDLEGNEVDPFSR